VLDFKSNNNNNDYDDHRNNKNDCFFLFNVAFLSCLNANEMLISLNDLLYLRQGKAHKLKSLTAFALRV